MQVKRPIQINKYYLTSLQDTYSKNTHKGATQKQSMSKQKKAYIYISIYIHIYM